MKADIVDILRNLARDPGTTWVCMIDTHLTRAANEIERLRGGRAEAVREPTVEREPMLFAEAVR